MFTHVNIWTTEKNSMKHHYQRNKIFAATLLRKDITDADYMHIKRVCKDFEIKKLEWIPWFACSKRYIIPDWCVQQLLEFVS